MSSFWLLCASASYQSRRVTVVYLETGHGFYNGHYGLDGITINHCPVLLTLIFWVAIFVDDPENTKKYATLVHIEGSQF